MQRVVVRIASVALAGVFGLATLTAAAPPVDADADGVPDLGDACPTLPGLGWNHGCPEAEPPSVTAAERQRLGSGKLELRATCNQPCSVRASGTVGRFRLGRTGWADYAPPSAPATLTLRLSRAKRAEIRAALGRRTSATATVTVTATMEGEPQSTKLTLKLTR